MRPYYAKPSWSDRYRVRLALTVIGECAFLIGMVGLASLYLWLLS